MDDIRYLIPIDWKSFLPIFKPYYQNYVKDVNLTLSKCYDYLLPKCAFEFQSEAITIGICHDEVSSSIVYYNFYFTLII